MLVTAVTMAAVLFTLSALLFVWAGFALGFSLVALRWVMRLIARTRRQGCMPPPAWPAIVILRPCEGSDAELEANLLSSGTARYDGPRRVVVMVPTADDPAYASAQGARAELLRRGVDVPFEIRISGIRTEANRKVAQLASVEADLREEVIVTVDSDLRLDNQTLPALIRALTEDPSCAAATAPQVEVAPRTLGDWASAALLSSTPHAFLCLAGLAERARGSHNLCGALVAYRRGPLREVGGFGALESYLGEDFEVARRFHERGYGIATVAVRGANYDSGRSLREVVQRFSRWSVVTLRQRPELYATYFVFLGSTPLLAALTGLVAWTQAPYWRISVGYGLVSLAARLLLAAVLRGHAGLKWGPFTLLANVLGGELLILTGALGAFGASEVQWRGHRYKVHAGGYIERLQTPLRHHARSSMFQDGAGG